jgi:hypothetical protein
MAPRLPWDEHPHAFLFHYTLPSQAEAIFRTSEFIVGYTPHARHGTGMFATDIRPGQLPVQEILRILFNGVRPPVTLDGVIVLRRDPNIFNVVDKNQFLWPSLPTDPGQPGLDLVGLMVGYGKRGVGREYLFPRWVWEL